MKFSERHGYVKPRSAFQSDDLDAATRNRLINAIIQNYLFTVTSTILSDAGERFYALLIDRFFKNSIDRATNRYDHAVTALVNWSKECAWHSVFDLLEFVVENDRSELKKHFMKELNEILEEEKVGFRFIKGQIAPIVNKTEVESLDDALSAEDLFSGMKAHIARSLELYSDRKAPDYRNSIKEAISAVESVCKVISGKKSATLADAVKEIEKGHSFHPALKEALLKLYGYSSDKEGIRHALMQDSSIGHAEAKFMLVSCSAFCNFLIERYGVE